jgi:hypothetical protein
MLNTLSSVIAVINPGQGQAPPGSGGVTTIVGWAAWVAVAVCVVGVLIAGISMAIEHRRGGGGESVAKLGWVMGACVVIGSASGLVTALV